MPGDLVKRSDLNEGSAVLQGTKWEPLLKGADAAAARHLVQEVASNLCRLPKQKLTDASLATGTCGLSLFFKEADLLLPGNQYNQIALGHLQTAIAAVSRYPMTPALHSGFTGVAWCAERLRSHSDADSDPNTEIDKALIHYLQHAPSPNSPFDLLTGVVGIGVYALERYPQPKAMRLLELCVTRLSKSATSVKSGVGWQTQLEWMPKHVRRFHHHGEWNLGLAHGTPGVIVLLAAVLNKGIASRRARSLLERAINWLLAQELERDFPSRFAPVMVPGRQAEPSRSTWCHGDPGVAVSLILAGRLAREPRWEQEGLRIARDVARRPPAEWAIRDTGLCHGSAGVAHLFHRLYQWTQDPLFARCARYWYRHTIKFRSKRRGIAGFRSWEVGPGGRGFWKSDPTFLTGAVGTAMALSAAITSNEPAWDRALLLSVP